MILFLCPFYVWFTLEISLTYGELCRCLVNLDAPCYSNWRAKDNLPINFCCNTFLEAKFHYFISTF